MFVNGLVRSCFVEGVVVVYQRPPFDMDDSDSAVLNADPDQVRVPLGLRGATPAIA